MVMLKLMTMVLQMLAMVVMATFLKAMMNNLRRRVQLQQAQQQGRASNLAPAAMRSFWVMWQTLASF